MAWALYYIAKHPDVDAKIYEEIKAVLGNDDVDHTTMSDLVYVSLLLYESPQRRFRSDCAFAQSSQNLLLAPCG